MTETRKPESGPDALDEAYRRASAADPSRPSEATRAAILANARAVAAAAHRHAEATIDTRRPAANDPFWWRSAAASVAIALVGLMIWAPHFESGSVQNRSEGAAPQELAAIAPASAPPPPAANAAAEDRAEVPDEQAERKARRLDVPAAPRMPVPMTRPAATQAPIGTEYAESTRAAAAPQPSVVAEPGASSSAGAPARAEPVAADKVIAPTPAAERRAESPGAPPVAAARKAELEEIVVTGGGARAAAARNAVAAPPAARERDSLARGAVAGNLADSGELDAAIARGDAQRVRALVAPNGALEARDARGRTPLMRAVEAGQVVVVRALLDAGADPNAPDNDGMTPRAKAANRLDIAALLEQHGGH